MTNLNDKLSAISVKWPKRLWFRGRGVIVSLSKASNTSKPFSHFTALKEINSLFPKVFNKRLVYSPKFSHFVSILNQDNMM